MMQDRERAKDARMVIKKWDTQGQRKSKGCKNSHKCMGY